MIGAIRAVGSGGRGGEAATFGFIELGVGGGQLRAPAAGSWPVWRGPAGSRSDRCTSRWASSRSYVAFLVVVSSTGRFVAWRAFCRACGGKIVAAFE